MRMRDRWFVRPMVGLFLLIALGVAGHWFLGWRAERALEQTLAGIAARGEPTRVEDLNEPAVLDAENVVEELRIAARLIDRESKVWERYDRFDPKLPLHDKEKMAALAAVQEYRESLNVVREARKKNKAAWGIAFQSPMIQTLLPDLNEQKDLSNLVLAEMLLAHEQGDHDAVVERARDVLAMGKATQRMPTLVSYLVGQGQTAKAAQHAGDAAVGLKVGTTAGEASPEQVRALIAELLDETWAKEGLIRAMHGERVMILDTIRCVQNGSLSLIGPMSGPQVSPALARGVAYAGKPAILNDATRITQYVGQLIAQVQSSRDWPTFDQAIAAKPDQSKRSTFRVASLLLPGLKRATETHFRVLATRRLAATALAIRLYAVEHEGRLPGKLEELVPKYLPAVPVDPMAGDGSRMKYIAEGDKPRAYSVGTDGRDDGGVMSEIRRNPQDIVFHLTRQEREKQEAIDDEIEDEEVEESDVE